MKERFILALCLFFSLSLQAQQKQQAQHPQPIQAARQVKPLSDLNKGDWFTLEYVKYYASPDGCLSLRNADIFEYQVMVSERTGNDIQFAIRPTRVCFHESIYSEKMNLPQGQRDRVGLLKAYRDFNDPSPVTATASSFIFNDTASSFILKNNDDTTTAVTRGGIYRTGSFNYFDSDYFSDFELDNSFYYGSQDGVTFKLNIKNGLWGDPSYYLKKKEWYYPLVNMGEGIKKKGDALFFAYVHQKKEAKSFFDEIIDNYFTNVNPRAELPLTLDGRLEHDATFRFQIIEASFPLPPNVKLSYYSPQKITAEDLILEVKYRKYDLEQDDNGFVRCEIFLPHPAMGKMIKTDVNKTVFC